MEKKVSQIISVILHPLLMPVYGLLILLSTPQIFSSQIPLKTKILLVGLVFITTVIIPILLFIYYRRTMVISSYQMSQKEERKYPYLSLCIIYTMLYFLFSKTPIHDIFHDYFLAISLLSILVFIINLAWKISGHAIGMGAITALAAGIGARFQVNYLILFGILVLLSGFVISARLKLEAHTPTQLYTGYLLGVVIFTFSLLIL